MPLNEFGMIDLPIFVILGHNISRATAAGAGTLLLQLFLSLNRCDPNGHLVDQQLVALSSLQMLTELRKSCSLLE